MAYFEKIAVLTPDKRSKVCPIRIIESVLIRDNIDEKFLLRNTFENQSSVTISHVTFSIACYDKDDKPIIQADGTNIIRYIYEDLNMKPGEVYGRKEGIELPDKVRRINIKHDKIVFETGEVWDHDEIKKEIEQKKEKRRKRAIIRNILFVVYLGIVGITIIPNFVRYKQAESAVKKGEYTKGIAGYEELGDFMDAAYKRGMAKEKVTTANTKVIDEYKKTLGTQSQAEILATAEKEKLFGYSGIMEYGITTEGKASGIIDFMNWTSDKRMDNADLEEVITQLEYIYSRYNSISSYEDADKAFMWKDTADYWFVICWLNADNRIEVRWIVKE